MVFLPTLALAMLCACSAAPPLAQRPRTLPSRAIPLPLLIPMEDGVSAADHVRAVDRWTRDYQKWQEWHERWRNRPEPGLFLGRARSEPPTPPAWLADSCANVAEEETWLVEGCRALPEWTQPDHLADLLAQQ